MVVTCGAVESKMKAKVKEWKIHFFIIVIVVIIIIIIIITIIPNGT